jgi:hypothetical protein
MDPRSLSRSIGAVLLAFGLSTCTDNLGPGPGRTTFYITPTGLARPHPPQLFVGAGDVSSCSNNNDAATAALGGSRPQRAPAQL